MISYFANPERFDRLAKVLIPICAVLGGGLILVGLPLALYFSPPDPEQGNAFRIIYVHVPSAWLGLFAYAGLGISSFIYFIWRHNLADLAARAIAPLGAAFTFLCLATGSLWGEPIWGTWWVWDARLTSMLVLLLLYLGYMALRSAIEDEGLAARSGAILAMIGLINLPIIKFSVDWWNSLHQPATVFRFDGPKMDAFELWTLLAMALGTTLLFTLMVLMRIQSLIMERRIEVLQRREELRLAQEAAR